MLELHMFAGFDCEGSMRLNINLLAITILTVGFVGACSKKGGSGQSGDEGAGVFEGDTGVVVPTEQSGGSAPSTSKDIAPPVPGSAGIINSSSVGLTSLILNWTKATDDFSLQGDIEYRVYRSSSNNLSSVADMKANGTALNSYTKDIDTFNVTGLLPETVYYFNVMIRDGAGNESAYVTRLQSTSKAWLPGYMFRQKIALNNSGVMQSLGATPILVELPATFNYAATHSDLSGRDIRFTSSDGVTTLPYYFEKWNYGSTSQIWVRPTVIPATGTAAEIYLYYGNASATDNQNEPAVWSQTEGLRLHADDSATLPNVLDSASTTFGTATAAVSSVLGILGNALRFDGGVFNSTTRPYNTEVAISRSTSVSKASIGMWIKPETGWFHGFRRLATSSGVSVGLANTHQFNVLFMNPSSGVTVGDMRGRITTDFSSEVGGTSGPWQFVATTWDQTDLDPDLDGGDTTMEIRSYVNGSLDMAWLGQWIPSTLATSVPSWVIGNRLDWTRPYKGAIDKLLIRESLDSADYFGIHYASVRGSEVRLGVREVANDTAYTVTVNGVPFTFTSDATATAAEIMTGLAALINAGSEPVSAGRNGTYLWINPDVRSVPFSLGISDRLSRVVLRSFQKDVRVTIGSVQNSANYTVAINGTNFNFVSDADANETEILTGLRDLINASSFPVRATAAGSNLEFSMVSPNPLSLSVPASISVSEDGLDRLLSIATVQNSTLYRVTVGGTNADYTSDSTATAIEIRNGIIQAINSLSDINAATASIEQSQVRVKAANPREFSIGVGANLNLTTTILPFTVFGSEESF